MAKKKTPIKKHAKPKPKPEKKPTGPQPPSPEFEAAVTPPIAEPTETDKDGRGGQRPGAGRPPGLTAVKAKVKNLPQQPNQTIKKGLESLFLLWANRVNVDGLRLSEAEADQLALPVTQLQEFYFPDGVPEIAWVWMSAAFCIVTITDAKIRLIKAARASKQQGEDTGQKNDAEQTGQ
jgi:hypothetical protein